MAGMFVAVHKELVPPKEALAARKEAADAQKVP